MTLPIRRYDPSKNYTVKGSTLNEWQRTLANANLLPEYPLLKRVIEGQGTVIRLADSRSVRDGFLAYRLGSGDVAIEPSIVSGMGIVAKMPLIDTTPLDATAQPTLTLDSGVERWIALKFDAVPDTEKGPDGVTYQIKAGAGTISGDITVEVYTTSAGMDSDSVAPVINTTTGTVTTDATYVVPLAKQLTTNVLIQSGFIGPLGVRMCGSGSLLLTAPARVVRSV